MSYEYLENWKDRFLEKTNGRGKKLADFLLSKPEKDNDILFDLHSHTPMSDGQIKIQNLLVEAENQGISYLSFTDHDTIKFYDEYYSGKQDTSVFSGEIIHGVEITSKLDNKFVEILLYDFDYEKLSNEIKSLNFPYLERTFKIMRNTEMLRRRIKEINGMKITEKPLNINDFIWLLDDPNDLKGPPISQFGIDAYKDLHINSRNFVSEISIDGRKFYVDYDCFNSKLFKFLSEDPKGKVFLDSYVDSKGKKINSFGDFNRLIILSEESPIRVNSNFMYPAVEDVCELAKRVGGVAILAHPYCYDNIYDDPKKIIKKAINLGVDGVECMYIFFTPENIQDVYETTYECGLLPTGGSDKHGYTTKPQFELWTYGEMDRKANYSKIGTYNLHYYGNPKNRKFEPTAVPEENEWQK